MWTISEVSELVGLGRRDIQRLCYADRSRGGLALLNPEGSRQGRRFFGRADIEILLAVAQYRSLGMSLPDAAEQVRRARTQGANSRELMGDVVRRLEKQRDDVSRRLAIAKAIEKGSGEGSWPATLRAFESRIALEGARTSLEDTLREFGTMAELEPEELEALLKEASEEAWPSLDEIRNKPEQGGLPPSNPLREMAESAVAEFVAIDWNDREAATTRVQSILDRLVDVTLEECSVGSGDEDYASVRAVTSLLYADCFRRLLRSDGAPLLCELSVGRHSSKVIEKAVMDYGMLRIEEIERMLSGE